MKVCKHHDCDKESIPGLVKGLGLCQYHYNCLMFGEEWAKRVRLPEHSVVKAIVDIKEYDTIVSSGSVGTIVGIYPSGYEVEFIVGDTSSVVYCSEDSIKIKESGL